MPAENSPHITREQFSEIAVQLPPNLMKLIGYPGEARYVALYYFGSKATWSEGRASCTFSYYNAYQPLIEHPVMAVHLLDADLGSDDGYPTHALICDREKRVFLLGAWDEAQKFIGEQHTAEPSAEEIESFREALESPTTPEAMHQRGMFEFLLRPSESAKHDRELLTQWLDSFISVKLIEDICQRFQQGDLRLWQQVEYFRHIVESLKQAQEQQGESGSKEQESRAC